MYKQLTREQRYAIYLGLQEGKSRKAIASQIDVHPSTVSREVGRNRNRHGHYLWREADECARYRRERRPGNRRIDPGTLKEALTLLRTEDWSPQQISGYLSAHKNLHISHETIYKAIRADAEGELRVHCRHRLKYRRRKRSRRKPLRAIPGRISIHERPPQADGTRFGDWEMDLIIGKGNRSAILTLCERSRNFILIEPLPDKRPQTVARAVVSLLAPFRRHVLSITTDNGVEFAHHQTIARQLHTTVYFADTYASWQKGAVENANKLIRQYLPKGSDFRLLARSFIKNIQNKLNRRPRKKLNFSTPKSEFFNLLL